MPSYNDATERFERLAQEYKKLEAANAELVRQVTYWRDAAVVEKDRVSIAMEETAVTIKQLDRLRQGLDKLDDIVSATASLDRESENYIRRVIRQLLKAK